MTERRPVKSPLESALRSIDVLRDIELVLVPLLPKAEMIDIACQAAGITPTQARLAYESMVRASIPEDLE